MNVDEELPVNVYTLCKDTDQNLCSAVGNIAAGYSEPAVVQSFFFSF